MISILNLLMDVMAQLPALIKDGTEAVALIESTLGTVRAAQAQGRDPTQAEWDAIHSTIDGFTARLDAPEDVIVVPVVTTTAALAPVADTPVTPAAAPVSTTDTPQEASAPVPVSDAGGLAPAATADASPPASDTLTSKQRYDAEDAQAKADLADFEAKAKKDFGIE